MEPRRELTTLLQIIWDEFMLPVVNIHQRDLKVAKVVLHFHSAPCMLYAGIMPRGQLLCLLLHAHTLSSDQNAKRRM
ncbi:hypothetical protein C8R48DRAFT_766086 [Suillus tomentosus]|nr:hypothetical protein C8R48DRAFT_766086 [Suillus tomentosus]